MKRALALATLACAIAAGCGDGRGSADGGRLPDGAIACPMPVPALVCADVEATCTSSLTAVAVTEPAVETRCGSLSGALSSDAPAAGFPVGDTIVTFTGTAASGAPVSCQSTVTVRDTTPPVIECPASTTVVRTGDAAPAPPAISATDGCDADVVVTAAPSTLPDGASTVTFTAANSSGLEASCTGTVTVLDARPPRAFRIVSARLEGDGSTDVTVAWDRSLGADVTGYAIERGTSATGPWTRVASVGTASRTFTDGALADDRAHYRVVALAGDLDGGATEPLLAESIAATGYDLRGRTVPTVPFATTLYGVVRHPRDLAGGPYPLVVLIHGNHGNCRRAGTLTDDGCATTTDHECHEAGWTTVPNAEGLAYLAETIAAQGHVAVTISANALNCRDDYILERANLVVSHVAQWAAWNGAGDAPFGTTFSGAIDLERVGLIGHSRGGEAVGHAPSVLRSRPIPGVRIASVFAIAPTDYHDPQVVDAPYAVLLPSCDGDVSTLEGMNTYDRSVVRDDGRYQAQVLFSRANHNYFSTEWRQDDNGDGAQCPTSVEIGATAQRGMLEGVIGTWLRSTLHAAPIEWFVRGEGVIAEGIETWAGTALDLRWSHSAAMRLPIDDFTGGAAPMTNLLGQPNTFTSDFRLLRHCYRTECDPYFLHVEEAMLLGWDETAMPRAEFGLGGMDASSWGYFSFRVASRRSTLNTGRETQDFWIVLRDAAGAEATLLVSDVMRVPHLYPANVTLEVLQTVRVPIARIAEEGVSPATLRSFEIRLPAPDRNTGSFLITDIELAN